MTTRASRAAWAAASLLTAALLFPFCLQPVGWVPGAAAVGLAALAAARPYPAVLVLAALGPMATIVAVYAGIDPRKIRLFEALVLAFLSGWMARHALRPSRLEVPATLRAGAVMLLALALASTVVTAMVVLTERFAGVGAGLREGSLYLDYPAAPGPVGAALLFAEGVVLLLATADVCAREGRRLEAVQGMMVLAASAAAFFNLRRLVMVSFAREEPWTALAGYLATLRVNVHHTDLNAAGSYFAMTVLMALFFVPRARVPGLLASALIAAGLWISGSRTALAAVCAAIAGAAVLWLRAQGRRRAAIALVAAGTLAGAAVLWARYPEGRNADPALALQIRLELARAALAMTGDHPWFGIGLGRFFELSEAYVDMPRYIVRENAHNNYLQILAELGVPGLVLFLVVAGTALAAARRPREGAPPWGVIAGLAAFLLTCVGGHPLLVPHAAYPFWMALGVAAASAGGSTLSRRAKFATGAAVAVILATLPLRAARVIATANLEATSAGLSRWQRDEDGFRYRWAGGRATFYVPAGATWVRIPLQRGAGAPDPVEVRLFLDGREADRVRLNAADGWRDVRLLLGGRPGGRFVRIDLEVYEPGGTVPLPSEPADTAGVVKVGRPIHQDRD